jgi:hypothetical protein
MGCRRRSRPANSGSSVRTSLLPVMGGWASDTLGVGDRYGVMVVCTVRERNGHTRGESQDIHSSQRSGLRAVDDKRTGSIARGATSESRIQNTEYRMQNTEYRYALEFNQLNN